MSWRSSWVHRVFHEGFVADELLAGIELRELELKVLFEMKTKARVDINQPVVKKLNREHTDPQPQKATVSHHQADRIDGGGLRRLLSVDAEVDCAYEGTRGSRSLLTIAK